MQFLKDEIIRSDNNVISSLKDFEFEPTIKGGLGRNFFELMKKHCDKLAQIDSQSGDKDTFRSMLSRSIKLALALRAKGITKGDIICSCLLNNSLNNVIPLISAVFIGAKPLILDPSFSQYHVMHLLKLARPRLLIVEPNSVRRIETVLTELSLDAQIIVCGPSDKYEHFADFMERNENVDEFEPIFIEDLNETSLLYCTSGTTSYPKIVSITHNTILYQFYPSNKKTENSDHDRIKDEAQRIVHPATIVGFFSLYWISSCCNLATSISFGLCRLLTNNFNPTLFWQLLDKYKPFAVFLSPYQAIQVAKNVTTVKTDFLSRIGLGGSAISKEHLLRLRQVFTSTDIKLIYGMTETFGSVVRFDQFNKYHHQLKLDKPGSCGLPMPGVQYKIVDTNTGESQGPYKNGELRVKSKYLTNHYYKMDLSEGFDKDGYYMTGDIVYYDDDYCFYVVDRLKDIISYRTYNISPAFIESVLFSHPSVDQCAVIGIPHEYDVNHAMALIVLTNKVNKSKKLVDELISLVADKLGELFELRGGVKFVNTIPYTSSGKTIRRKALQMVLDNQL